MSRKLTARGEERRAQLLAYATARFADAGYDATSVSDIVEGLGVGKGVFYWYFSSKEELFAEALAQAQRDLRVAQRRAIGDETDPLMRLALGIEATLRHFDQHRDTWRLIQLASNDRRFSRSIAAGQEVAARDIARVVREAMDQGQVAAGDPMLAAHLVLGAINQVTRVHLHQQGRGAAEITDEVVRFCLGGLGPAAATLNRAS